MLRSIVYTFQLFLKDPRLSFFQIRLQILLVYHLSFRFQHHHLILILIPHLSPLNDSGATYHPILNNFIQVEKHVLLFQ